MGGASGGFWCSLLCADEQAPRWIRNVAKQPHVWMECKGRWTKKVIELVQEKVKSESRETNFCIPRDVVGELAEAIRGQGGVRFF